MNKRWQVYKVEDEKVDEDDGLEMNCSISDDSIIKLS